MNSTMYLKGRCIYGCNYSHVNGVCAYVSHTYKQCVHVCACGNWWLIPDKSS